MAKKVIETMTKKVIELLKEYDEDSSKLVGIFGAVNTLDIRKHKFKLVVTNDYRIFRDDYDKLFIRNYSDLVDYDVFSFIPTQLLIDILEELLDAREELEEDEE